MTDSSHGTRGTQDALRLGRDSVVVATQNQASCGLAEEVVILDMKSGIYFGLGPVGARIWSHLRSPSTVESIQRAILAEFEVDAETCLRETLTLLEEMREAGLVEVLDGKALSG